MSALTWRRVGRAYHARLATGASLWARRNRAHGWDLVFWQRNGDGTGAWTMLGKFRNLEAAFAEAEARVTA